MSHNQKPSPPEIHPNVTYGDSCGFMDQETFQPCNHPAHWKQQGSGIPLCDPHAVIVTKAGGRCTAIKP